MEENYSTWRQLKSFKDVEFNNLGEYRNKKTGKLIKKRAFWRPIKGFPDYEISNFGKISSNKFNKRIYLKPTKSSSGYYYVKLSKNKKPYNMRVNRLVAKTFISNPENKPEVNHIDGNKLNNKVINLEWCNRKQNIQHAWNTGLMENARIAVKKNAIIAHESCKMPIYSKKLDIQFDSIVDAATYIQSNYYSKIDVQSINVSIGLLLLNKITKSKYDYGWQYI